MRQGRRSPWAIGKVSKMYRCPSNGGKLITPTALQTTIENIELEHSGSARWGQWRTDTGRQRDVVSASNESCNIVGDVEVSTCGEALYISSSITIT